MNDVVLRTDEIKRVAPAAAAFLGIPLEEIVVLTVSVMSDGFSHISVGTNGRIQDSMEGDAMLAAELSKSLGCPVLSVSEMDDMLDEYVDGVFSRRLEIDESGETAVFIDKP